MGPDWKAETVAEAAERTGYNPDYLKRLIRNGKIEAEKFGPMYLIRTESLNAYIANLKPHDGRTGPKR